MSVVPMMLLILTIMLLALATVVCLGVWTYRDAKARGLEAGVWTAVVVLVPSFIGLLLYLLVGRRRSEGAPRAVVCPSCGATTEAGRPYCSSCGGHLDGAAAATVLDEPVRTSRAPLVAAIVCVVLGFALVVGTILLGTVAYMGPLDAGSMAVGEVQTSSSTSWRLASAYLNGSESRSIAVPKDGDAELRVDASVGEGTLELVIAADGEERERFELGTSATPETVDLSPYAGYGWITLRIEADRAHDVSVDLSW